MMNKNKEQIQKISAHVQFETVSPATKLLEERRKMYEVHEAFEVQKDEFKKYPGWYSGTRTTSKPRRTTSANEILRSRSISSTSVSTSRRTTPNEKKQKRGSNRTWKSLTRRKKKFKVLFSLVRALAGNHCSIPKTIKIRPKDLFSSQVRAVLGEGEIDLFRSVPRDVWHPEPISDPQEVQPEIAEGPRCDGGR